MWLLYVMGTIPSKTAPLSGSTMASSQMWQLHIGTLWMPALKTVENTNVRRKSCTRVNLCTWKCSVVSSRNMEIYISHVRNDLFEHREKVSYSKTENTRVGLGASHSTPLQLSSSLVLSACLSDCLCVSWDSISLYSQGWSGACYIAQAGLKLEILLPQPS
jgi:hypothetical protein